MGLWLPLEDGALRGDCLAGCPLVNGGPPHGTELGSTGCSGDPLARAALALQGQGVAQTPLLLLALEPGLQTRKAVGRQPAGQPVCRCGDGEGTFGRGRRRTLRLTANGARAGDVGAAERGQSGGRGQRPGTPHGLFSPKTGR